MSTFKEVAARLRVLAQGIPENVNAVVRKTALAMVQTLVLGTPVDTGRARGNWQVNLKTPATGIVTGTPKSAGDSVGVPGAAGSFAITNAVRATSGFDGGSIFITNNLPYIVPLNEGHSKQAPAGFVETAILNGIKAVKGSSILEKPTGYGDTNGK